MSVSLSQILNLRWHDVFLFFCIISDEFDADDLCQSTVFHSTKQTVWSIYNTAAISGVKHVFMTGSYFNHPFIREKITEWWLIKTIQHHAYDEKVSDL